MTPRKRRRPPKRKRLVKQEAMARLTRKAKRGPFKADLVIRNAPGREKMSVVLKQFVEPYVEEGETLEQYRNLISFGVIAWNCALLPEDERNKFIAEAEREFTANADHGDGPLFRRHLAELVERKQKHFAKHARFIVEFEVTDMGDEFHLAVVSSLD